MGMAMVRVGMPESTVVRMVVRMVVVWYGLRDDPTGGIRHVNRPVRVTWT